MQPLELQKFRPVLVLFVCACFAGFAGMANTTNAGTAVDGGDILAFTTVNGISARVYTADYLSAHVISDGGRGTLELGNGEYLILVTDISDPLIQNKGDGQFHPIDESLVVKCLEQVGFPNMDLDVEIFVLPYPRVNVLSSSATGGRIYLSPQVLEISNEGAAYIIAHELGHVFQYRYLPDPLHRRWDEYRRIRGIADQVTFASSASHAYRPHEIFAEDFRVLFGGPDAYFGGRVENPVLPAPASVAGLESFFLRLTTEPADVPVIVSFSNFPNPFNPQTELRVRLSDDFIRTGDRVTLRIYDVTGALVRELFGERPNGPEVRVMWDGRDRNGRQVASSTYFGVVDAGSARMTTKLLMIK